MTVELCSEGQATLTEQEDMTVELYDGAGRATLVETWGDDRRVVASARMSTDGAFRGWGTVERPGDEKLLEYLWLHHHHTPFEMCGVTVEYEVPIFVERQMVRHRTMSRNELSARYTELPEHFYTPKAHQIRAQDRKNRQVGKGELEPGAAGQAAKIFEGAGARCFQEYRKLLELGVSREQARSVLPLGTYTRVIVSGNLRNWLHLLGLRLDAHAQTETRELASAIHRMVKARFPRTAELFDRHSIEKP